MRNGAMTGRKAWSMPRAANTSAIATNPSSHQWFAVTVTATMVMIGWARIQNRHRLVPATTTARATSAAQATCTDGNAESWSAMPVPTLP